MAKIRGRFLFVISSAARNLRFLTLVRDDNVAFGDYDTASSLARGDGANKAGQRCFPRAVQPPVRTRSHLAMAPSH